MTALAAGITPADLLNSTTALVVAIITMSGSVGLSIYDRKTGRRKVATEWEKRADALTKQLSTSYAARLREKDEQTAARLQDKDEQIRAITDERNYWRSRWMGVRDDRGGGDRRE